MEFSEKQKRIYEEWENSSKNIVISAVAGAGKSTTLIELLKLAKKRTLFLAFNKSIKDDLEEKIKKLNLKQGKAMTLHSLGFIAIKNFYKKVVVKKSKNWILINKIQEDFKKELKHIKWKERLGMFYTLCDCLDNSRLLLTDNLQDLITKAEYNRLDFIWEGVWKKLLLHREDSYSNKEYVEVDFLDMIYLVVKRNFQIPVKPFNLFIDEAQDLTFLQHVFIENFIRDSKIERWVAVGDKNQSIYGFAGAHANSFNLFKEKDNTIELPLDICYRCDLNIINHVNEVYNVMLPFKKTLGVVKNISLKNIPDNSLVICRNTKPLVDLYFFLISQKRAPVFKGDDIKKRIFQFLKPYGNMDLIEAKSEMSIDLENIIESEKEENSKYLSSLFNENKKMFEKMLEFDFVSKTVKEFIRNIEKVFEQDGNITLSSIHKSKGLEANTVIFLNSDLIPSKFAVTKEELKQEKNLLYVARSRAKKELFYANIE